MLITLCGEEPIFWKGPAGNKIWNPVICFYVVTDDHKILVDTGLCDEARATKYHHKCEKRGCLETPQALKAMGVNPEDIDMTSSSSRTFTGIMFRI